MNSLFFRQSPALKILFLFGLISFLIITGAYFLQNHAKPLNSSSLFDTPEAWGSGYALAIGQGEGVVVGPGVDNPNVLGQKFPAKANERF